MLCFSLPLIVQFAQSMPLLGIQATGMRFVA